MGRFASFVCFTLIFEDILQFFEKLAEIFSHEVSSNRMNFVEIIGGLPLVDVELSVSVIESVVVIKYSSSNFQVSKTNASGKSSKIVNGCIVSPEKLKDLLSLRVVDVDNFFFGDSGVVRAVGDWPWVVVTVESVEVHRIRQ